MASPKLRSPLARAVLPVVAGIAALAAIGLSTWGMAAYISSGDGETTERLAPSEFTIGPVESLADEVEENGPLLFPELGTAIGTRSIVVDHTLRGLPSGRVAWSETAAGRMAAIALPSGASWAPIVTTGPPSSGAA